MKKLIIILFLLLPVSAHAQGFGLLYPSGARSLRVDTIKFGGVDENEFLTTSDQTVQIALDTLNFLPASNLSVVGDWDFTDGRLGLPAKTTCTVSCTDGDICYDTDATSGQRIYACESGTWTVQGGGGGGGGGWTDGGTDVTLSTSTDNVGVGGASLAKFSVDGDTDEIQGLLQANATQTSNIFVIENSSGTDLMTSALGGVQVTGPLRVTQDLTLNKLTNCPNLSNAGKLTVDVGGRVSCAEDVGSGAAAGWTDNGADVNLTTSTDNVGIGGSSLGKLSVDGDADEVQLLVQGNSTQTTNIFVLEENSGTDIITAAIGGVKISEPLSVHDNLDFPTADNNTVGPRLLFGGAEILHIAGTNNTFVGENAGFGALTLGGSSTNTGFGASSIADITSGDNNTAVGFTSCANVTTGSNNTCVGRSAGDGTTGDDNTSIGALAGGSITTGARNTLVGEGAGNVFTTGVDNVCIGDDACGNDTPVALFSSGCIGANCDVIASKQFVIGDADTAWVTSFGATSSVNNSMVGITLTGNVVGVSIRGGTGQDKNLLIVENSAGTDVLTAAIGGVRMDGTTTVTGSTDENRLMVRGSSNQVADIFVIENSAGADVMTAATGGVQISSQLSVTKNIDLSQNLHCLQSGGCIDSTGIKNDSVLETKLKVVDAPADEECLSYETTGGDFEWQACGGGASEVQINLNVQSAKLPQGSPAAIDAGESNWRLLYDASADEVADWTGVIDDDYGAAALSIDILYSMLSATSGDIIMTGMVTAITAGDAVDINAWNFDAENTVTETVPGTAGQLGTATITLTNADSLAAGDYYKIRIGRDANAAGDTATGDAEVVGIVVRQ